MTILTRLLISCTPMLDISIIINVGWDSLLQPVPAIASASCPLFMHRTYLQSQSYISWMLQTQNNLQMSTMGALVQFSSWRRDMELQQFVVCQFHDCQILLDWMEVIRKLKMVENEESSHLEPAKTNAKSNLLVSSSDMLKPNCVWLTSCNHNYQLGLHIAMLCQQDEMKTKK